jgi:hypothetical protein
VLGEVPRRSEASGASEETFFFHPPSAFFPRDWHLMLPSPCSFLQRGNLREKGKKEPKRVERLESRERKNFPVFLSYPLSGLYL